MAKTAKQQETSPKDAIDLLNEITGSISYPVWVPSKDTEYPFKALTAEDQKKLIKASVMVKSSPVGLQLALNQVLANACISNDLVISDLDIYDKLVIAIQVRANSISSELNVVYYAEPIKQEDDDTESNEFEGVIDLNEHISRIRKNYKKPQNFTIKEEDYEITVGVPDVATEAKFLQYTIDTIMTIESKNPKEAMRSLGSIVSVLGHIELASIIKTMRVKTLFIDMSLYGPFDRISIVERIPWKLAAVIKQMRKDNFNPMQSLIDTHAQEFEKDGVKFHGETTIDYNSLFLTS